MKNNKINILGFNFLNTTFKKFMETIKARVDKNQNTFIVTANPEIVTYALDHEQYSKKIKKADYLVADGVGILKGAKILGEKMPERITGYDILLDLLDWGNKNNKSAYFIGAKPEVMSDLKKIINKDYPNLIVKGTQDGYFKNEEVVANDILNKKPDMVFVALGFPKQENFIVKYKDRLSSLWIGLGGSFDVLSGHTNRAPQFWIDHNIEWLYRLIKEPSRFKRMLALPKFILLVKRQNKKSTYE
ncbi:WecB/TagA/CpsF family glycosyltransferase [Apilactobacillus apisilvae]|uniref:N-acetylglucosaminyldiphosphoundecaprenol N-acetyl-beta-D-mannosaminyltransferase n=1 Tax=Apilactobacillus apisilvae TaxID=2923364 RepID=A0ABY4PHW8_9LACO|nr:WecB/TagA/CpsF family glycosyltransferase [Apilactobacillus apisilvae]UQS85021.1 WecB/TagA/CpsF family glycosyltransferase [Apilactobacillus apisilvae]